MSGLSPETGARESRAILAGYGRQLAGQLGPGLAQGLRRLKLGLRALAGRDGGGWFIPYRYAQPGRRPAYPALEALFDAARPGMERLLDDIRQAQTALRAIPPDGPGLRWSQSWFPRLDAAAAYVTVRRLSPRLIVEVGSGHSTRFLMRALQDGGHGGALVAIDPAPRAALDLASVRHIAARAEDVEAGVFAELGPGDVLFIDSSHIAMPGTDVDRLLLDVLPQLPSGVHIHVHDVFLPDPYPESWGWRGYNEQIAIGALVQGGGYEIVFASWYARTRMAEAVQRAVGALPLLPGAYETSLWLRKR
ncbi:class I SAM-dependent methyltransferase [Chelatococcus reniformis]|uniref:Class I SAM-dependent methyltransferase n=1 Tax=Chelatococcus reniformis TaxID=1494448 RepID=A0A916XQ49_9HYPH|nr:class I SAM-dependent methyltransferase [Chelatococcus reniformis]GGC91396.1 hypothetical protein GCM10010994_56450 [Chelatococcus reniformis]